MINKFMVIMGFMLFPGALVFAEGDAWKEVSVVPGKYRLALDSQNFKRGGERIDVPVQFTYAEPKTYPFMNFTFNRTEQLYTFYCDTRKAVVSKTDYFYSGVSVYSEEIANAGPSKLAAMALTPRLVLPGMPEEDALDQACKFVP